MYTNTRMNKDHETFFAHKCSVFVKLGKIPKIQKTKVS